jgi:hypothetical protein
MTAENIRMTAEKITELFKSTFELEPECVEPSSYWSPEMVMIEDEQHLPLEMRLYCSYESYKERKHKGWHFFSPSQVFRQPWEEEYLIAQCGRSNWLLFNKNSSNWKITNNGNVIKSEKTLTDIMNNL